MSFNKFRNLELSTVYYITNQINTNWNNSVIVQKSFKQATTQWSKTQPVICVRAKDITPVRIQVGSEDYRYEVDFIVDVFGTSDGLRLDLAASLTESLKIPWSYFTWAKNSGDDDAINSSTDFSMRVFQWHRNAKIDVSPDVAAVDKFRHILSFTAGIR